jgi:hypothetical protein
LQGIDDVVANDFRRAFIIEHGAKCFERGHLLLRERVDSFIARKKSARHADKNASVRMQQREPGEIIWLNAHQSAARDAAPQ